MWTVEVEVLESARSSRYQLLKDSSRQTWCDVLRLWSDSADFRTFFCEQLAEAPFTAFRWETPGLTTATVDRDFEFVLLDCPPLVRPADVRAFADHFAPDHSVVTFPNLSGDATMVVPCPLTDLACYGHLAAFVRQAPAAQVDALWQAVGQAMRERLSEDPVWLSTAGMGVAWLHVRLDSRPKYYGHTPYRKR